MRRVVAQLSFAAVSCTLAACGGAPAQVTPVAPAPEPTVTLQVSLADVGLDVAALDRAVDPCSDFYQFACGGWIAKTEIPADESSWYLSFNEIDKRNEAALREILDNVAKDNDSKLGKYYAACMDEAAVEATGVAPITDLLKEIKALKDVKQLPELLGKLHRRGIKPLFHLSAEQDFGDATRVIASLDQGGLGMPDRDDYLKDDERSVKLRAAYRKHVQAMLELAGWKPKDAATATEDTAESRRTAAASAASQARVLCRAARASTRKTVPVTWGRATVRRKPSAHGGWLVIHRRSRPAGAALWARDSSPAAAGSFLIWAIRSEQSAEVPRNPAATIW